MIINNIKLFFILVFFTLFTLSCSPNNRLGMISNPETGLQYGSVIEKSFFIDSSQLDNDRIKITARNVSGDIDYNINDFITNLRDSFARKGYSPTTRNDFGIKYDVIIEYSGHMQSDMSSEYAFLGGAAGGIAGYRSSSSASEAIGLLSGATLGAIAGSYVKDDTYIIIARVTLGITDNRINENKTITFSSSPKLQEEVSSGTKSFQQILTTRIAVFAGGRNVKKYEILDGVRSRLERIAADVI